MLLRVQRELRFGEPEWLRAEPTVSLVVAPARGAGAEHGSSPGTRAQVHVSGISGSSSGLQQGHCDGPRLLGCRAPAWRREMGLPGPSAWSGGLFLDAPCTTQDHSLTELGVVFCLLCHKRLILWRVLEGSEIHLE